MQVLYHLFFRYPTFTTYDRLNQFCGKVKKQGHPTPEFLSFLRKCLDKNNDNKKFTTAIKLNNKNITECFEEIKRRKEDLLKRGIDLFIINVVEVKIFLSFRHFLLITLMREIIVR